MAYNLAYIIRFDSFSGDTYRVEILGKDYNGSITNLTGAKSPLVISKDNDSADDNPMSIQEATNAKISFIYEGGKGSLQDFYTEADDGWLINFYLEKLAGSNEALNALQWAGYIVQDDSQEEFQDAPYIVELSANDSLGLMKDVPYNEAVSISTGNEYVGQLQFIPDTKVLMQALAGMQPERNSVLSVLNSAQNSNSFTIVTDPIYNTLSGNWEFDVYPLVKGEQGIYTFRLSNNGEMFNAPKLLSEIVANCLRATGIELPIRVYWNIYENRMKDRTDDPLASPINQLIINLNSFLEDAETYISSYEILTRVCHDFNLIIVQADGFWNIWHTPELKYLPDNAIPYTEFDNELINAVSSGVLSGEFTIGLTKEVEYVNADAVKRLLRPYKFVKDTFNYNIPPQVINNGDIARLGAKLRERVDNDVVYVDYELVGWQNNGANDAFIRVVLDRQTGIEKERYIYQPYKGNFTGSNYYSTRIPVNAGDQFDLALSIRGWYDPNKQVQFAIAVYLFLNDGNKYVLGAYQPNTTRSWDWSLHPSGYEPPQFATNGFTLQAAQDASQWTGFSFSQFGKNVNIIADGELQFVIWSMNASQANVDGLVKDVTFNYYPFVNNSIALTGQTHTAEQGANIKNKFDEEIYFDDSPKDILQGTLFIESTDPDVAANLTLQIQHRSPVSASFVTFDMLVPAHDNAYYTSQNQTWWGEGSFKENGVPPCFKIKRDMTVRWQGQWIFKMVNENPSYIELIIVIYGQNRYVYFDQRNIVNGTYTVNFDRTFDVKAGDWLYFWYSCPDRRIIEVMQSNVFVTFNGITQVIEKQKTNSWHRFDRDESLRIGQFSAQERLFQYIHPRIIIEGTAMGLKTIDQKLISLLHLIKVYAPETDSSGVTRNTLEGYNFKFGIVKIDYAEETIEGTIIEVLQDSERDMEDSFLHSYNFNYLYKNSQ